MIIHHNSQISLLTLTKTQSRTDSLWKGLRSTPRQWILKKKSEIRLKTGESRKLGLFGTNNPNRVTVKGWRPIIWKQQPQNIYSDFIRWPRLMCYHRVTLVRRDIDSPLPLYHVILRRPSRMNLSLKLVRTGSTANRVGRPNSVCGDEEWLTPVWIIIHSHKTLTKWRTMTPLDSVTNNVSIECSGEPPIGVYQ